MLFITNRRLLPDGAGTPGRKITFDLTRNDPTVEVFYCRRDASGTYTEIGSQTLMGALRAERAQQVLLYLHGFNEQPELTIFPKALRLQGLCDALAPGLLTVVPLVWPCDDDFGLVRDYWDDQEAADFSAAAFARALGKLVEWRAVQGEDGCRKPLNVLAHSMGARVLRGALHRFAGQHGAVPRLIRNLFLVAADVRDETLEPGEKGAAMVDVARNVCVYFAGDDLAMRASKAVNLRQRLVSRRLGHAGPADMSRLAHHVHAIDCADFNNDYDPPDGHSYFLAAPDGRPGAVLAHMVHAMRTGRVDTAPERLLPEGAPRTAILPASYPATPFAYAAE